MTASGEHIPEVVRSETVHHGYPFDVSVDTLRLEDGREVVRPIARHPGAIALVALDEEGRWLLVRQYRHAATRWLLEIPAGTLEAGEAPEVTAARELREETGFAAARLERLGGTWMAPGFCTEYITYFLATGLREDPLPHDDDEEFAPIERLTVEELHAAVRAGAIEDAKTLAALQLMALRGSAV